MLFRLPRAGGAWTWCRIEAGSNGAYQLEIIDEAGLDLSLEFDADEQGDSLAARHQLRGRSTHTRPIERRQLAVHRQRFFRPLQFAQAPSKSHQRGGAQAAIS